MPFLLLLAAAVAEGRPFGINPVSPTRNSYDNSPLSAFTFEFRGGASSVVADENEDVDLDESDEAVSDAESNEEPIKIGTKLAASAVKATGKAKSKKVERAKSAVNAGLAETTKKSAKKTSRKLGLPYIVRVCLNPLTVFAMTKAYFASLFNLDYVKKVSLLQTLSQ